jgi:GcrA cell cycle regulator
MTGPGVSNIAVPDFSWTEERVTLLKTLWNTGMSCSLVGEQLGCSRNAVISKVHRLRLKLSGDGNGATKSSDVPARAPKITRPRSAPARDRGLKARIGNRRDADDDGGFEVLPLPDQASDQLIPAEQRKTLFQLNEQTCRWPVGDPSHADFFFCGAPPDDGPYCSGHARVAYSGHGNGRDHRHYNGHRQI